MAEVRPMPRLGDVFTDVRGADRTMRVSFHDDVGIAVVSLWDGRTCRASFRLAAEDVPRLAALLRAVAPEPAASESRSESESTSESTSAGSAETAQAS